MSTPPAINPEELVQLVEAEPKLSIRQLALRLCCSTSTIRRYLKAWDITPPRASHRASNFVDPLVAEFFTIHDRHRNSDDEISREAGVTPDTINRLRNGRHMSVRSPTLQKLFRVYGYQLKIERIQND